MRSHRMWASVAAAVLVTVWPCGGAGAATAAPAVLAFGDAPALAGSVMPGVVGMATTGDGHGYWLVDGNGRVAAAGDAVAAGDLAATTLAAPVVGMARTPDSGGYWLGSSDGGVFAFGDAPFLGSAGALHLNAPVVGMAATPDGRGYWLVASDGGVFTYGDAPFLGSAGALHLNAPVVAMAATPDGRGYWLVASDGGVFTYGDAPFLGSAGSLALRAPVAAMAATPDGRGYWLAASDGGVFTYGDAPFLGSGAPATGTVVAMAGSADGQGYWLAEGAPLAGRVIVLDPGHNGANGAHPDIINRLVDIITGEKPCDTTGTETADGYTEAAYNFDVATRAAALLRAAGATVMLTRPDNNGVGPCIDERAAIANRANADASISIHADGGPATGRGFHVIEPAPIAGHNTAIVPPSVQLGSDLHDAFADITGMPNSDYVGTNGIDVRDDLGGLNLSTVPKVFIETGNMVNPTDAALLENPGFRDRAAQAIVAALAQFERRR